MAITHDALDLTVLASTTWDIEDPQFSPGLGNWDPLPPTSNMLW